MLGLLLIIIATASLFYYYIVKPYSYWKDRGVKQGNPKWIVGDSWGRISKTQSFAEMAQMIYNQCPGTRYSGFYQFFIPALLVKDPELIKRMTVKDFNHFTDHRSFLPENADPLWSKNLVALKGKKWREMRSLLTPCFTSSKMRTMSVLITECAENFTRHFLNKNEDVVTVEFKDAFTRFTNDVIASTAFGIQIDSSSQPNNDFYMMGKQATEIDFWRGIKMMGYFLVPKLYDIFKISIFSEEVGQFFQDIVRDAIKVREEKGIVRPDMINLLMEVRNGTQKQDDNDTIDSGFSTAQDNTIGKPKSPIEITDLDIAAQAMVFFLAGFDSVASLMSFVAYELAINPDIQDKLRREVNSTFAESGNRLTYDGLLKMKYLDTVVSETLRKWPIASETDRICTMPYTIDPVASNEKLVHLEEGAVVIFPIYGLHHDPQYFPEPDKFDPERFNDVNKGNIKPFTYCPFGLGQRNCIGSRFALLETKTVIFMILKHFVIVPIEKSKIPLELSKTQNNLTADGGFWFGLKRI